MPSESLADVKQRDWIRACRKLGLKVETNRGKGSHLLVKHPSNGSKCTVQSDLHRIINVKILNHLKRWGFTEEQVFEALK